MIAEALAYRYARKHVEDFQHEGDVIQSRAETLECRDCESFLQLGIEAYEWLGRADTEWRLAMLEGKIEYDAQVEHALEQLYEGWLRPASLAIQWVSNLHSRGITVANRDTFWDCLREVTAIVAPSDTVGGAVIKLRDDALADLQQGQAIDWDITS